MDMLNEIAEKLLRGFFSLKNDDWIEWIAEPNDWQDDCDKFNGCYFIVKQMPQYPQHLKCRCRLKKIAKPIPNNTAKASVDILKFTGYIFSDKYDDGKQELFKNWGYTIEDSEYLKQLYSSQAVRKYCNGEYLFKGTGKYYTRIEILVELPIKNEQTIKIKTGWVLLPEGELKLSTPFTGFAI